ncbi:hypothetical protein POVCU1_069610, partial [Plasmodium ovale curtisi]
MSRPSGDSTGHGMINVVKFKENVREFIKQKINKYGHTGCILVYDKLCKELERFIKDEKNKTLMGQTKEATLLFNINWSNEEEKKFLDSTFQELGFKNLCHKPYLNYTKDIRALILSYLNFCKEKDGRRSVASEKDNFSSCTEYNAWIDKERKKFQVEYLKNSAKITNNKLLKYFRTMNNSDNFVPLQSYISFKLNCAKYTTPSRTKQQKIPGEKSHPVRTQSTRVSDQEQKPEKKNKKVEPKVDVTRGIDINNAQPPKDTKSSGSDTGTTITPTVTQLNNRPTEDTHPISTIPSPIPTLGNNVQNPTEQSRGTPVIQLNPPLPPVTTSDLVRDTPKSSSPDLILSPSTSPPLGPSPPPGSGKDSGPEIVPPSRKAIDSQITTDSSSLPTNTIVSVTSANAETVSTPNISTPLSSIPATVTALDPTIATASDPTTVTASDPTTSKASGPATVTKSARSPDLSPGQAKTPVLDSLVSASPASSTGVSTSTTTSTVTATTTTTARTSDISTTISTVKGPVTSTVQVSSTSLSQDPNLTSSINKPNGSSSTDDNQQTSSYSPKPGETDTTSPVVTNSGDPGNSPTTTLTSGAQEKSNAQIQVPQSPLSISTSQDSAHTRSMTGDTIDNNPQTPTKQMNQQIKRTASQHPAKINVISSVTNKNGDSVNASKDKISSTTTDDSILRNNTNDNSNIIPEGFPPLMHVIPTLLVIMATITTFLLLYK